MTRAEVKLFTWGSRAQRENSRGTNNREAMGGPLVAKRHNSRSSINDVCWPVMYFYIFFKEKKRRGNQLQPPRPRARLVRQPCESEHPAKYSVASTSLQSSWKTRPLLLGTQRKGRSPWGVFTEGRFKGCQTSETHMVFSCSKWTPLKPLSLWEDSRDASQQGTRRYLYTTTSMYNFGGKF